MDVTWSYGQPVILEKDNSPDPVWSYGKAELYYEYEVAGWGHKIMGVTPSKVMGVTPKKIMGVE